MFKKNSINTNLMPIKTDRTEKTLTVERNIVLNDTKIKIQKTMITERLHLKTFNKELRLPKKDEIIKIRTQKSHNTFTYILAILEKHKIIDELIIITYNINEKASLALNDLLKNNTIKSILICASSSISYRMPKRYTFLKELFQDKIYFTWNHCKITLVKTGNNYYVIEGSGNMTQNSVVEQYILENSKESYDFDKNELIPALLNEQKKDNNRRSYIKSGLYNKK